MRRSCRPATGIYVPETYSVRLSIKLFNCTPENLPSDLRRPADQLDERDARRCDF